MHTTNDHESNCALQDLHPVNVLGIPKQDESLHF